jgi:hypothetical protein
LVTCSAVALRQPAEPTAPARAAGCDDDGLVGGPDDGPVGGPDDEHAAASAARPATRPVAIAGVLRLIGAP